MHETVSSPIPANTPKVPDNQTIRQEKSDLPRARFFEENNNEMSINSRSLESQKITNGLPIEVYPFDWVKNNEEGKAKFNFMSQHDLKCDLVLRSSPPESVDLSTIFIMVLLVAQGGTMEDKKAFAQKAERVECVRLEDMSAQNKSRTMTLQRLFSHISQLNEYFTNLKCLKTNGFGYFKDWLMPSSIESLELDCRMDAFKPYCISICNIESLKSITISDLTTEDSFEIKNLPNLESLTIIKLSGASCSLEINQFPNLKNVNVNGLGVIFDRDVDTTVVIA